MKKVLGIGVLAGLLLFSCSKEEDEITPLAADFTATVTGESPNAEVVIINNSTGATSYSWTFGEGADINSSTDEIPVNLKVDKAGDLNIQLVVSNGSEEKELTKTITISGNSAVETYSDVEFGLTAGDENYGRLFSFETGQIYKDSEINETNGSMIHLAFGSMANTMYYFESPAADAYNVPNANETNVVNYEASPTISVNDFDSMTDDSKLSGLSIVGTDDSFGNSSIPGTVLFEISSGRKGVIKTKAVNSDRLLVDIKIQKY